MRIIVIGLLSLSLLVAGECEFGYADCDGSRIFNVKNSMPFVKNEFQINPTQKFQSTIKGNVFDFNVNVKRDIDAEWDMFGNIDFLDNDILGISKRIDYKLGVGYTFINEKKVKQKISYAAVAREDGIYNSWRYKYSFTSYFLDTGAVFFWVTKDSFPDNSDEITGDLFATFKLFKLVGFNLSYNYSTKGTKNSYLATAGLKFKY